MAILSSTLQYNGMVVIVDKPIPLPQLWFIAKNINHNNVVNRSHIWYETKTLGCKYSDNISKHLEKMDTKTYVSSMSLSTDCTLQGGS